MAVTLKRSIVIQALFALCIAIPYLGNYELAFALWVATAFLTLQKTYSVTLLKYSACFLAILIIAVFTTDFGKNAFYIVRDITYLFKPIVGLFIGYQLCKLNYTQAFKTIIYTGFGIAVIHLSIILTTFLTVPGVTMNIIRVYSGFFSDFEVYALIILLFHKRFGMAFTRKRFYLLVITIGLSGFMYFARTNFIQFFILLMAMKGYFVVTKRAVIAIVSVVVTTLLLYGAVVYSDPKRNGKGLEALLYKIKIAPTEPFKLKIDTKDYIDYNDNYRSVELTLTLRQVTNNGPKAIIFGEGLGSQVDLKRKVYLGDMDLRYISVLHNAFMTVFLKSGLLGILILLYSIYFLARQKKSEVAINNQINFLLVGTAVFLLVSNWVLMGYYFTRESKSILVGLFIAYKEITARRHQSAEPEEHIQ